MKRVAILYAAVGVAAVIAGVGIPWLVHSRGGAAVAGWQGLVTPGPVSSGHSFIAGRCEACHAPHEGVDNERCVACHAAGAFQDKPSTRFHAQARRCQACHVEHQGPSAPTAMDHAALLDPKTWRAETAAAVPHTSWSLRTDLLSPIHDRPEHLARTLRCAACHAVEDPHQTLFGAQCGDCHSVGRWAIAGFRHPSMASTDCVECHRPPPSHGMMHFSMVSQRVAGQAARLEQCYACHATDAWNNIRGRGYYKHH